MRRVLSYLTVFIFIFTISINKIYGIEKSIKDYNYGVSGKVSIASFYDKMKEGSDYASLIISNDKGIDVMNESGLTHIDVTGTIKGLITIDDINNDGIKDIVYITNSSSDFYNLIAVSTSTGDIIWKTKISKEAYSSTAGYILQNASLYSLKRVNDNIAVIYNYDFSLYDMKTGKEKFHYKDEDNIWDITEVLDINKDKTNDYVISNQLGELKAFSGKTNKILWKSLVTPKFKVYNKKDYKGQVSRNLWQVEFINDSIYVIGEDGTLYNVNYKNGKISNKLSIYAFDEELLGKYYSSKIYYSNKLNPISKNSFYYKMFEIIKVDDERVLVTAFMNRNVDATEEKIDITYEKPFFASVNLKDMSLEYKVSLNDLEINNVGILVRDNEFIVPVKIKDEKLVFNSYDRASGEEVKKYELLVGNTFTNESTKNIYFNLYGDKILLESIGNFSFVVNSELKSIIKNNDTLSYPYVLTNSGKELTMYYKTNNIINKIVKYSDYVKDTLSFEYNIPTDFKNGGLTSIEVTHDFNNDGVKDLTALVNKLGDKDEVVASYFLVLDMNSGKVISFRNIFLYSYKDENKKKVDVYLTGSDLHAVTDVNKDKKVDLVLDNNIIDGSKYKVIGSVSESVNESGKTVKVGDINNDGFTDFVNVLESQSNIYLSKKSLNSVSYNKTSYKYTYDKALMNYDYVYKASDINNDGINELVFNAKNANGLQYFVIVSGRDLSVISSLEKDGINEMMTFEFLGYDVNNDGYRDVYETANWNTIAKIISGKTGEELISFKLVEENGMYFESKDMLPQANIVGFYETSGDKNVILGEDLTGDGNKELFVLKETYYPKQEVTINAYDVFNKNSEVIKKYTVKNVNNDETYYYMSRVESDNDYFKKLIRLSDNIYIYRSTLLNKYVVYDIASEKEISSFNSSMDKAYLSEGKILGIYNNSPVVVSYENDFKIKEKSEKGSILKLSWEYNETGGMNIVKIYDNDRYILTSYASSSNVLLPKGKHTILVESIDKWGKTSNYSFDVNIEKGSDLLIVSILAMFISIMIILYLSLVTKVRRKRALGRLS